MLAWVVSAVLAGVVIHLTNRLTRLERSVDALVDRMRALQNVAGETRAPSAAAPQPERPRPLPIPPPIIPPEPSARAPQQLWGPASAGPLEAQIRLTASAEASAVKKVDPTKGAASLEAQIGSNWLLYIGVVAIVVGVAYFEKLAFDNNWIGPAARVIQGAIAGAALFYGGWRFMRTRYRLYGQMIAGGGAAVFYLSIYAAFTLYHLIGRPPAFVFMCVVTAVAAWSADRRRAQGLALMAVGGGFATPFLLSSAAAAQIALFTYEAILIAGTMYLAHRRTWPWLNALSYAFTVLTVLAWASRFYTSSKYLVTEIFLTIFCAMYLYILRESRRSQRTVARLLHAVLHTAPFAYYIASLAILANHPVALLVYLVAATTAGCMAAARMPTIAGIVRLVLLVGVALPLLAWISSHTGRTWLVPALVTSGAIYVIHLIAHFEVTMREEDGLGRSDIAALHANALAAYLAAHWLIDAVDSRATAAAAALFAIWQAMIGAVLINRRRGHALHFMALAFTFLAVAIAIQFDGVWITIGWAAEGAVLMWLGLHERRNWLRAGGLIVFAMAVAKLLDLQFAQPTIDQTVLLNRRAACGAFVIALLYATTWLHAFAGQEGRDRRERREGSSPSRLARPSSPSRPFSPYATEVAAALVSAQVLTLSLFTSEIGTFWGLRLASDAWPSGTADGRFVRELMLSITWAVYATGLIVVGIRKRYAPLRYTAFAVFGVTIVKVFGVDLARLDRIYRVSSILGLGVMLLLTSYLYHRFRGRLDVST